MSGAQSLGTSDDTQVFPLVFVSTYNNFENLAHKPKGKEAEHGIHVFSLDPSDGSMTLLTVLRDCPVNPAFLRFHPTRNVLYTCSESIFEPGIICAYSVSAATGSLREVSRVCAEGTSTCYLTVDGTKKNLLFTNYWDSTLGVVEISRAGHLGNLLSLHRPPQRVVAQNIADHLANRQSEPHAHALVLDPVFGRVAYVPDLGEDVIKQYIFNSEKGILEPAGEFKAGEGDGPHGPRYIAFHPSMNVAFVVNELASTVSVFEFDEAEAEILSCSEPRETLHLVHTASTLPAAFPRDLNTCGRIAVDPSGKFVLVSNRGHNSITVFRVNGATLAPVGWTHTRGKTPRHFQFDESGKFLLVANQDTNSVAVFHFDAEKGRLYFSGNDYEVPSPNFVCIKIPFSLHHSAADHQKHAKVLPELKE